MLGLLCCLAIVLSLGDITVSAEQNPAVSNWMLFDNLYAMDFGTPISNLHPPILHSKLMSA